MTLVAQLRKRPLPVVPDVHDGVSVVLATDLGRRARVVGRRVHVAVELLLPVPVISRVADEAHAAGGQSVEQRDQATAV